ncbi:MAG: CHASE domain-containing protein [Myxococcales bacterium]|nr:CHASE domain-containing protein [Myxococcales bacterium]
MTQGAGEASDARPPAPAGPPGDDASTGSPGDDAPAGPAPVAASPPRPPARASLRVALWPALLLASGLVLAFLAARVEHAAEHERRREAVRAELRSLRGALSRELFGAIHLTEGIASLISVEGGISEDKFRAFATELFRRNDLVQNVAVAPDNVIRHVYPLAHNEKTLGLDYRQSAAQWPSIARMIDEARMVVAGPVELVQGGVGVIGRTPVYVTDPVDPSAPPRYWGLTSTVLRFDELLERAALGAAGARLRLALRGRDGLGDQGEPFWGDPAVFADAPVIVDVPLPSGSWQLAGTPARGWPPFSAPRETTFQLGALISLLLAGLLLRLLQIGDGRRAALDALTRAHDELEARVAARTDELRQARDAARSADQLKSAFLATMSHELRTPLNSIIGFTGILVQGLAGPLTPEQDKQLRMVQGSARHLLALINDVLDISKIEAGQLEMRCEPFDLRASVERVVASVAPLAEKKGLALRVEVGEAGELDSDSRRVEQIVLNLLHNAIKFTDAGEVAITVEADDVADAVRVVVADTGPGIRAEDLGHLFQPFRQLDTGLQRRHEGTGLGLAICRRLADLLGGSVTAASAWGEGSRFTLTLPRRPPPA